MASLPDYDQLKSAIERQMFWPTHRYAPNENTNSLLEEEKEEAKEAGLSIEEFREREESGSWIFFLNEVRDQQNEPEEVSKRLINLENAFQGEGDQETLEILRENEIEQSADFELIKQTGMIDLLAEQDISNYSKLSEAAEHFGIKSWQLIEYIESLRDDLVIPPHYYNQNIQNDYNEQATESAPIPVTDANTNIIENTVFDPSQNPKIHAQSSGKPYLIPALLSGIGLLLIILIAVILKGKATVGKTQEKSSINKSFTSNQATQNMLGSPKKQGLNSTSTAPLVTLNQIEKKFNCRFPRNESNDEFGTCKVVKRTNANNHIVYDVYPHFENLNKFAVVLWNNNTAEFFYEGKRYEATTSDLKDKFIEINANNSDYKFSFIPSPRG